MSKFHKCEIYQAIKLQELIITITKKNKIKKIQKYYSVIFNILYPISQRCLPIKVKYLYVKLTKYHVIVRLSIPK